MVITVNGTLLQNQFNDAATSVINMEIVADNAINTLNIFLNTALDNLTNAAGSKTGDYTSAQAGAILAVALQVYREMFKHAEGISGGTGAVSSSFVSSDRLLDYAEKIAEKLNKTVSSGSPPIYVSNDPVATE